MSSFYYFKQASESRREIYRLVSNAVVATTITLWTPLSGKRVALTNLVVTAPIGGSMALYFQSAQQLERQIIELRGTSATSTIIPAIDCLESTAIDCPLLLRVNIAPTDGWAITATGFDLG